MPVRQIILRRVPILKLRASSKDLTEVLSNLTFTPLRNFEIAERLPKRAQYCPWVYLHPVHIGWGGKSTTGRRQSRNMPCRLSRLVARLVPGTPLSILGKVTRVTKECQKAT